MIRHIYNIMTIFDLFGLETKTIIEFLSRWGIIVSEPFVQIVSDIIVWGLALLATWRKIIKPIALFIWSRLPFSNRKKKGEYIHRVLDHDFKEYLGKESKGQYVETQFISCPPHEYDEPNKSVTASTREPMSTFCDRVLNVNNPNERLYMILAGSGMGKTTLMVNLFCYYVNHNLTRKGLPLDIRLLKLDDENIISKIENLSKESSIDPNKTILLLDALDENREAAKDFPEFQKRLESAIEPFGIVMLTCRDQFFDNEKQVPEATPWVSTGRDKNLINYNRIYISPFSDDDINKYIEKKYKKHRKKRKQAHTIIKKCKSLMVRPLLLSYIDDLLDNGNVDYKELSDIYETLIDKWLQREVNLSQNSQMRNSNKNTLYKFSADIAKTIYHNWQDTKSLMLSSEQMKEFMNQYKYNDVPYDTKRRSLINRNISGCYKFAHKSFLEFFLAKEYFKNSDFPLEFDGMDMARQFYEGMCVNEYKDLSGAVKMMIPSNKIFESEIKMRICNIKSINFKHLAPALRSLNIKPTSVCFEWKTFSNDLLTFLDEIKVANIEIDGYEVRSDFSLKKLLDVLSLSSIKFVGNSRMRLPNSFLNMAKKLNVLTMINEEIVTPGAVRLASLPFDINIDYQFYKRTLMLNNSDLKKYRTVIGPLLGEDEI